MSEQDARFISRVLLDRDITTAINAGVTRELVLDPDYRDVFDYIVNHSSKYNEVPSPIAVRREFPKVSLRQVGDGIEYVIDALFEESRRVITRSAVEATVTGLARRATPMDLAAIMQKALDQLNGLSVFTAVQDLTNDPVPRYAAYQAMATAPGGLLGVPTGFPTIDQATAGLQPGQLVTIIASPKTGKSQLALRIASNVHEADNRVLFQGFEMSNEEQEKRFDAMRSNISHNRLRRGDLTTAEEGKYQAMLTSLERTKPFILSDSSVGITVSAVAAKATQHVPDLLVIDGVYLMVDERSGEQGTPQSLTNITRSLKRLAQRLQIPVLITTQTLEWKMKKRQVSASSIGYSSSFYQDSDVILGLERTEDDDETLRNLKIVASRNSGGAEVSLIWDWESGRFEEPVVVQSSGGFSYGP